MNIRDLIGEATEYDKKLELDVTQDVNSNDWIHRLYINKER